MVGWAGTGGGGWGEVKGGSIGRLSNKYEVIGQVDHHLEIRQTQSKNHHGTFSSLGPSRFSGSNFLPAGSC